MRVPLRTQIAGEEIFFFTTPACWIGAENYAACKLFRKRRCAMRHRYHNPKQDACGVTPALIVCLLAGLLLVPNSVARDLMPQKEQEKTQSGEIYIPALDQENWKRPQGMFSWIAIACGWKVPDDTYGRAGWFMNARIMPVSPGVAEFPPDQPAVYIVYEIPSLDAPMQMNADWYFLGNEKKPSGAPLGKDSQYMDMNEGYGYLEVRQPEEGWKPGDYLVKIYISSPGQQIHALSQVGTMQFSISTNQRAATACN